MLSERRQIDPAYELQCAPLLQYASAVWEHWHPRAMLEQGLRDAVGRFTDHGNPWASIRGLFFCVCCYSVAASRLHARLRMVAFST
eukprot:4014684-Pyramimonas_sp.AAC.1